MSSLLPEQPCFDHYRRAAKDLLSSARSGGPEAIRLFQTHFPTALTNSELRLADAQHVVAKMAGMESWPKLKATVIAAEAEELFNEVDRNDVEDIRRRLKRLPALAKAVGGGGQTALHQAAEHDNVPIVEILIKAGADPEKRFGESAHTALSWAITVNAFDAARALKRLGAKVDLFSAAGLGDLDLVKGFWTGDRLKPNASVTGSSRFAEDGSRLPRPPETESEIISDAMVMACRGGQKDVALWLLSKGGDLGFRGYIGGTALHWAEYSGSEELCAALRVGGASDTIEDREFLATPRAFGMIVPAAWNLVPRLAARLDRRPEEVDIRGGYGTPLNAAAWNGNLGTASLLLERGADKNARNAAGLTPLGVARHREFHELAEMLERWNN